LPPNSVDGTGTNAIQFDVTVNAGDTPNVLAVLGDTDFTEYAYRWFTLSPGQHTLTLPLSPVPTLVTGVGDSFVSNPGSTPGLNLADIDYVHIQVDAHGSTVPYDVDFNNLALTTVPEPAALMGCAMVGLLAARRRR
jgi:MYXO-CTERM domain-containing protein